MTTVATTHCLRCGTCCEKGGPSLHHEDRSILEAGAIEPRHLITVRKGEPVMMPFADRPAVSSVELVKINGQGGEWTCRFYNREDSTCGIYRHRPVECVKLQCWDTAALEEIIGRDTLRRLDIIKDDDPLRPLIEEHEKECSWLPFADFLASAAAAPVQQKELARLTDLVRRDLAIRSRAVRIFPLPLDLELFYFGRPAFSILAGYGISTHEKQGKFILKPGRH